MRVRQEEERDYRETERITRDAFWNLYVPGANEHALLHTIRATPQCVKKLTLVAEDKEGAIMGVILYTIGHVMDKDRNEHPILTFGPVSVNPAVQGKGIGSLLIKESISLATSLGYKGIIILGYPFYYERFGFENAKNFGISMADGSHPKAMLALELEDGALAKMNGGHYIENSQFELDADFVEKFDSTFPPKEKYATPSQRAFTIMLSATHNDSYPYEAFISECVDNKTRI